MTYYSLLDGIRPEFSPISPNSGYEGNLDNVLLKVGYALERMNSGERFYDDNVKLVFHSPRIIRAFLDYKIERPSEGIEDLLREGIDLGLDIYSSNVDSDRINHLRKRIEETGNYPILGRRLFQRGDNITLLSSDPGLSKKTAKKVADGNNGESILLIALGHGGTMAGMDVYLRYCDITGSDSEFYVVRFSRAKKKDEIPKVTSDEIDYLRSKSDGRQVVIFDEDTSTGSTMEFATRFFGETVFPGKRLEFAVNYTPGQINPGLPVYSGDIPEELKDLFNFVEYVPFLNPIQEEEIRRSNIILENEKHNL